MSRCLADMSGGSPAFMIVGDCPRFRQANSKRGQRAQQQRRDASLLVCPIRPSAPGTSKGRWLLLGGRHGHHESLALLLVCDLYGHYVDRRQQPLHLALGRAQIAKAQAANLETDLAPCLTEARGRGARKTPLPGCRGRHRRNRAAAGRGKTADERVCEPAGLALTSAPRGPRGDNLAEVARNGYRIRQGPRPGTRRGG